MSRKGGTGARAALLLAVLLAAAFLPAAAPASESIESLAARDPLSALSVASFLGDDGRGMVITRPGGVEVSIPGPEALSGTLNVFFVNVGQGDAEYIELPNGRNVLIDGGPAGSGSVIGSESPVRVPDDPSVAPEEASEAEAGALSRVSALAAPPPIAKFLKERGVTRIDYVVLTHPHSDHYGGLGWVFDNLSVGRFYDTAVDNPSAKGDGVIRAKASAEPGCGVEHPAEGSALDWAPGVRVGVLNTCSDASMSSGRSLGTGRALDMNDCSIVLKMTYGSASLLFTGDAGVKVEERMVRTYGDLLASDVLKVGHHGSTHSSSAAFLEKVRPKYAYIEVGKNSYGHPTPAAVARIEAAGASMFRTDRDGTGEYARREGPEAPVSVAATAH
ncbi:MAG: MBL fold metallo-hydrolase [Elusimicrobiota bacterium]|jgi:competence protein ComEC